MSAAACAATAAEDAVLANTTVASREAARIRGLLGRDLPVTPQDRTRPAAAAMRRTADTQGRPGCCNLGRPHHHSRGGMEPWQQYLDELRQRATRIPPQAFGRS